MNVGIDDIDLYIPNRFISTYDLSLGKKEDPEKAITGIGQDLIAIPDFNEDIITMGAESGCRIANSLNGDIDMLIFATESSFDLSKSGSTFLHELLNIKKECICLEIKQACYSMTAALNIACDFVTIRPDKKVLVIGSDIAKYDLDSSAEYTQGAGSVAILVKNNPRILTIEEKNLNITSNCNDFFRPIHKKTPIVNGKLSVKTYLEFFSHLYNLYIQKYDNSFDAFALHLPFSKMLTKASNAIQLSSDLIIKNSELGSVFSKLIGNTYSCSLFISFLSLLVYLEDLSEKKILFFSYGSGSVGEIFSGILKNGYLESFDRHKFINIIKNRDKIDYSEYLKYHNFNYDVENFTFHENFNNDRNFYLKEIKKYGRIYIKR